MLEDKKIGTVSSEKVPDAVYQVLHFWVLQLKPVNQITPFMIPVFV